MLKIAIIEDDSSDYTLLDKICHDYLESIHESCDIVHYSDAESFLNAYRKQFNLIFMDIELPGINGMEAAQRLRQIDTEVVLIFLTNLMQYAIKGYEVNAIDYILKPVEYEAFSLKMPRILRQISRNTNHQLVLTTKNGVARLSVNDLCYVEVITHDLLYHTLQDTIRVRGSLREIEAELQRFDFRRCNNCYLVNLKYVKGVFANEVQVGNDTLIISRPRRKQFLLDLAKFNGGVPNDRGSL